VSAPALSAPSLILAMHDRYEQSWIDYNRLDRAACNLHKAEPPSDEWSFRCSLEQGRNLLSSEKMALTTALCQLMPSTWQEALVLAFHLHTLDPIETNLTDAEKQAFTVGSEALLDFMFSGIDTKGVPGAVEPGQLVDAAGLVMHRRRMRRAQLAEAA
jgi:hypothetical protein